MSEGDVLGYDRAGSGPRRVMVLNDWMCDTSTWDGARAYLDGERFSPMQEMPPLTVALVERFLAIPVANAA